MRHTTETEQPMERSWYCVHSPFATDSPTAPEQPTRSMRHAAGTKHFQRGDGRRTSCYIACMERSRGADVAGVRAALLPKLLGLTVNSEAMLPAAMIEPSRKRFRCSRTFPVLMQPVQPASRSTAALTKMWQGIWRAEEEQPERLAGKRHTQCARINGGTALADAQPF